MNVAGFHRCAWRRWGLPVLTSIVMVTAWAEAPGAQQDTTLRSSLSPDDAWDTFVATVTVRMERKTDDGRVIHLPFPILQYGVERENLGGQWTTTTRASAARVAGRKPDGTFSYGPSTEFLHVEEREDGKPIEFTLPNGRPLGIDLPTGSPIPEDILKTIPPVAELPKAPSSGTAATGVGRNWTEAFVATSSKTSDRRAEIQQQMGQAIGRVGELDRYLSTLGNVTTEMLVDPATALPVELNVAREGKLLSHTLYTWRPGPGGSLVRAGTVTESADPRIAGERSVVFIEIADVRFEKRR